MNFSKKLAAAGLVQATDKITTTKYTKYTKLPATSIESRALIIIPWDALKRVLLGFTFREY